MNSAMLLIRSKQDLLVFLSVSTFFMGIWYVDRLIKRRKEKRSKNKDKQKGKRDE